MKDEFDILLNSNTKLSEENIILHAKIKELEQENQQLKSALEEIDAKANDACLIKREALWQIRCISASARYLKEK